MITSAHLVSPYWARVEAALPSALASVQKAVALEATRQGCSPLQLRVVLGSTLIGLKRAALAVTVQSALHTLAHAPSLEELHALAERQQVAWDEDPTFMAWTEKLTGKRRLDELTAAERQVVYDALLETNELTAVLTRLEQDALTELRRLLMVARDALMVFVLRHPEDLTAYINDLRLKGANDLQNVVKEWLRGAYERGAKTLRQEAKQYRKQRPTFVPTDALRYLTTKALTVSNALKQRVLDESKLALLTSLKLGESTQAATARLEAVFEPYVGNETVLDEGDPLPAYRLETIVRTNTTEAFNQGRVVQAREFGDVLHGLRYSAILDTRTTAVCEVLDGYVIPLDDPALEALIPPNHFNCRSMLIPVPITEEVDIGDFITADIVGQAKALAGEGFV